MKWERGEITLTKYIVKNLKKGITVGMDFNLFTKGIFNYLNF